MFEILLKIVSKILLIISQFFFKILLELKNIFLFKYKFIILLFIIEIIVKYITK
jgi:hypothetical protein